MIAKSAFVLSLLLSTVSCHIADEYHDFHFEINAELKECTPPMEEGLIVTPFKTSYADEEKITLSCQEGYDLREGHKNATCQGMTYGGYAKFKPTIGPRICTKTPRCVLPIQEGIVVTPFKMFYEIGENISVSCMDGYTLNGDSALTCQRGRNRYHFHSYFPGILDDASFKLKGRNACSKIEDCRPPIYEGLTVKPFKPFYGRGEEISLSCDEEYELVGANSSMCDETGSFDIDDGIKHDGYDNWGIFRFSSSPCKKKATCSAPKAPHTVVTPLKTSYTSGDEVTISCEEGYVLVGSNTAVCGYLTSSVFDMMNPTGRFEPPISIRTCSKKPRCFAYKKKGAIITPEKAYYMVDEVITVTCEEGYELLDPDVTTRTCTQSSLGNKYYPKIKAEFLPEMNKPMCRKKPSCKSPNQRGVVLTPRKKAYDIGELVEVSCEEGYELKRSNKTLCKQGRGRRRYNRKDDAGPGEFAPEIDNKVCEKIPSCSPPRVEGLTVKPAKSYYIFGEKVTLTCEDGYEMRVAPVATCRRSGTFFNRRQDGEFDPEIRRDACQKPTVCMPPQREGLVISPLKSSYIEGDMIMLSCSEGYKSSSEETMICERSAYCDGQRDVSGCFFPHLPKKACIEKPKCDSPAMKPGLNVLPMKDNYYVGDDITLSCSEGYILVGQSTSTCVTKSKKLDYFRPFSTRRMTFYPPIGNTSCKKIMATQYEA
ncbi:complement factor H-like [Styela clava]